jgi:cyclomaltodextrinase
MEEFIFGTTASNDLKLLDHRVSNRGFQHAYRLHPNRPLPGESVAIRVQEGCDIHLDHAACIYTIDGSEPAGSCGEAVNGQVVKLHCISMEWDTITWGYVKTWEGILPPLPEGTVVRYIISGWDDDREETFADWPDAKLIKTRAVVSHTNGEPIDETPYSHPCGLTIFSYHLDNAGPPDWGRRTVMYQIFIDRFYPGDGRNWIQTSDLNIPMGGTLWGVIDKLDYIADLGVDSIWLSPFQPSPTYHGYDITDFYQVHERLGGSKALHKLVDVAHKRGIRVIMDFVCNHVSSQHPFFVEAQSNPNSRYRNWFFFDESMPNGYLGFFEVATMPELNLCNPEVRTTVLDAAAYWLRDFHIDGYRLDYANGPDLGFWSDFKAVCRATNPDCFLFGEVVDVPASHTGYEGRLDGLTDFALADAIRRHFGYGTLDTETYWRFKIDHLNFHPPDFIMLRFLDNHDMDRFIFIAGGSKERLKEATREIMMLDSPVIIYYGTEVGMNQSASRRALGLETARLPMEWDPSKQDRDLLAFFKQMIRDKRGLTRDLR